MHKWRMHALLLALTSASAARAQQNGPQEQRATAQVYADVASIAPGSAFHLAVEYRIDDDWHIYWVNPGDTGFATTVEVSAPAGFVVGPVLYPGPHRFEAAGDLVSFGYEHEATLIIPIKAPGDLAAGGKVQFDVRSDWLVCKTACLIGSADLSITLPTVSSTADVQPANAGRFAAAEARLPRRQKDLEELKTVGVAWTGTPAQPMVTLTAPRGVEAEIFPLIAEGVLAGESMVVKNADGSRQITHAFEVDVKRLGPAAPQPVAVLRIKDGEKEGDAETWYELRPKVDG